MRNRQGKAAAKKSESPEKQTRRLSRRSRRNRKSELPEPEESDNSAVEDNTKDDNDNQKEDSDNGYARNSEEAKAALKEEESGGTDGSCKVKSENGGGGGIPKLKLCVTRPPEMSSPTSDSSPSPRRRGRKFADTLSKMESSEAPSGSSYLNKRGRSLSKAENSSLKKGKKFKKASLSSSNASTQSPLLRKRKISKHHATNTSSLTSSSSNASARSPPPKKRRRRKYNAPNSSSKEGEESKTASSSSSIASNERKASKEEKEKGLNQYILVKDLDKHFSFKDKSALKESEEHVKKFKKVWEKAFDKIPRRAEYEEEVLNAFFKFFTLLFDNKSELMVSDTHKKGLPNLPVSLANCYKSQPDLTITHQKYAFNALAVMHVELRSNLSERDKHHYYKAYSQVRDHALELLFGDGSFVPRNRTLGLISDGYDFSLFIFFIDGNSLKHDHILFSRQEALDVLIKIAHLYKFENFKMPITEITGEPHSDLLQFDIPYFEPIHKSDVSVVFAIVNAVIKINALPMYKDCIENEFTIYKKLMASQNLPILTLMGHHKSKFKSALMFREMGDRLQTLYGMHSLVPLLKKLHGLGYVHRDIRPCNLLRVYRSGKNDVVLIDYGFACTTQEVSKYIGSWETASDRVLKQLQERQEFAVQPEDDLESLVKTMILILFNDKLFGSRLRQHFRDNLRHSNPKQVAENLWKEWDLIKNCYPVKIIFSEIFIAAQSGQYDELVEKMKIVEFDLTN